MPRIQWASGQVEEAPTWAALLDHIRDTQVGPRDPDAFREELAKRAWVWGRVDVDPRCKPRDLFEQLEKARLLRIMPDRGNVSTTTTDDDTKGT